MDGHVKRLEPLGVLVLVKGLDPKLAKAEASPFYSTNTGVTTLSGSGLLLPASQVAAQSLLVPALLVRPFVRANHRHSLTSCKRSELLPSTRFEVLLGGSYVPAEFQGIMPVPEAAAALQDVLASLS
ncbi:hypothetical protein WJX84_008657, partial [Apatococcus fuscideae]